MAARTYAVRYLGRREALGFDVFATVQDQVYGGVGDEYDLVSRAVRETTDNQFVSIDPEPYTTFEDVVLDAWRRLPSNVPLRIVGDGPLAPAVAAAAQADPRITWEGQQPVDAVAQHMRNAWMLIVPSICYDTSPLVLPEAAAAGLPVVGSRIGGIPEGIDEGESGVLVEPGDAAMLADTIARLHAQPEHVRAMGRAARTRFERRMSAAPAYERLLQIYGHAMQAA